MGTGDKRRAARPPASGRSAAAVPVRTRAGGSGPGAGPGPGEGSNPLEQALKRSEAILARSQGVAHLGSWEWDTAAGTMEWSDETYRILGFAPGAFSATPTRFMASIHPEDEAAVRAATRNALRTGGRFSFDHRVVRPTGEIRFVHGEGDAVAAQGPRVLRMAGIIQDVTARQRDAQRLEEFNRRLGQKNRELDIALENIQHGLALYDAERRLVLWNRAYVGLYRLGPGMLSPGMPLSEVLECAEISNGLAMVLSAEVMRQRVALAASHERHSFLQRLPDGRVIQGLHQPLRDGGLVATLADLTERERREAELVQAKETADAASRAKTEFLATMSHELRTPLNAIIGFSDMLVGEVLGPLSPRYHSYAEDIAASGQHLLGIINAILDMSKIEAGRFELKESDFHLESVVRAALRVVGGRARDAGLTVSAEVPRSYRLRGDERITAQILVNLLSNAVKFTPAGGTIEVRATKRADGLALSVQDSGIGIAKEDIEKALQPFGQIDSSLARKYEGTGLGLPLVKSLLELHGGSLVIDSEPGLGTTATALFPPQRTLSED